MAMEVSPMIAKGLKVISPQVFTDQRGCFYEAYNKHDFFAAGIRDTFIQDNESVSSRGVIRGFHFQLQHPQGKLIRVVHGTVFEVVIDLRALSQSFGRWEGLILSGELRNQLYIPSGFANGFLVLSDEAIYSYKCAELYHPEDEAGIRWDDPTIAVSWPDAGVPVVLSEKDKALPFFDPSRRYFDTEGKPI